MIEYKVSLNGANSHIIEVELQITQSLSAGQVFWLPAWIPGSYMIRDFAKNIVTMRAFESDKRVTLEKIDKTRWQLTKSVDSLNIKYQVYAWDLSVRSAHFDDQHCFFNGTSCFLALENFENEKHFVVIEPIEEDYGKNWQVYTAMPVLDCDKRGFGRYQSNNYSDLIDNPFEVANAQTVEFEAGGVVHTMAFTEAPDNIDLQRIAKDVQKICQYEIDFFGDNKPPFESYLFMTFVQKRGFGGLEHLSSTALHCSHSDLPRIGEDTNSKSDGYKTFLSLCSHEYFHCWNVKRIKPSRLANLNLIEEVNTELLWFFEGITSYYDEFFLRRAGVIDSEEYLDMLAKAITRYRRGTGKNKQTVTDSSFDAWTKFYKQDENAPNAIVSYYVKGSIVALVLDFELRKRSHHKLSLDDLMRTLWRERGSKGIGVNEKEIQTVAESLLGENLSEPFNKLLYSTEDLPLEQLFDSLGVEYQLACESKQMEKGGYLERNKWQERTNSSNKKASLSISHKANPLGAEILSVLENGSASLVGLSNKDIIIAVNDIKVDSTDLDEVIANAEINSEINISYFRRDRLYHKPVKLIPSEAYVCYLTQKTEGYTALFDRWTEG